MADETGSVSTGNPDGGAAPTGTGAVTPPPAATAAPAPWYGEVSDPALKGWVENKQFKTPGDMVQSYHNLEKLFGHDKAGRTLVLPNENSSPEERAVFFEKLGRPATADKYEMPTEGADPNFTSWAQKTFFEANLTAEQAKVVTEKYRELEQSVVAQRQQERASTTQADGEALRREWGKAYEDKMGQAKAAAREFGIDAKAVDALESAMGYAGVMKFFANLGSKIGEHGFVGGGASGGFRAMTPDQAQAQIAHLRSDEGFRKAYTTGDAAAKAKMRQLHEWAYPEG